MFPEERTTAVPARPTSQTSGVSRPVRPGRYKSVRSAGNREGGGNVELDSKWEAEQERKKDPVMRKRKLMEKEFKKEREDNIKMMKKVEREADEKMAAAKMLELKSDDNINVNNKEEKVKINEYQIEPEIGSVFEEVLMSGSLLEDVEMPVLIKEGEEDDVKDDDYCSGILERDDD